MSIDPHRQRALEVAASHNDDLPKTLERATAYHAFLSGTATPAAKPAAAAGAAKPAAAGAAKPAAAGAAKPAAGAAKPAAAKPAAKPAAPAANAKAPGGKHTQEEVRDMIRKVARMPGEGQQSAMDILANDGGGVQNVSQLKPEHYDAVFEACANLLAEAAGGDAGDAAEPDMDPTA